MGRIVIWSAPAQKDIKEITTYWNIRNKSNTYSHKLRSIIRDKLDIIKIFPFIGIQTDHQDARCFIISDYKLFYVIKDETIIVLRLWDTRQNPEKFKL
ncbi:MAG: type II toxin-antitoxin system RelE/ParE family toxin [Chitinophagales bacterium]|nr:type II toxin-antitoxin system RelE/ParE family toxin [Bacteroidota bacterium]